MDYARNMLENGIAFKEKEFKQIARYIQEQQLLSDETLKCLIMLGKEMKLNTDDLDELRFKSFSFQL